MPILQIIGDILWIIALSFMSSASWAARKRIPAGTMVPMQWGTRVGHVVWRAPRWVALSLIPVFGLVIGILLVVLNRNVTADPSNALILFGVRALVPAIIAIVHFRWLKAALTHLEQEGAIKP